MDLPRVCQEQSSSFLLHLVWNGAWSGNTLDIATATNFVPGMYGSLCVDSGRLAALKRRRFGLNLDCVHSVEPLCDLSFMHTASIGKLSPILPSFFLSFSTIRAVNTVFWIPGTEDVVDLCSIESFPGSPPWKLKIFPATWMQRECLKISKVERGDFKVST
eukprot:1141767-Pelagomonas_calceolata.AAC.6